MTMTAQQGINDDAGRWVAMGQHGRLFATAARDNLQQTGRWLDNVFVERLRRRVKFAEVYLRAHDSIAVASASLDRHFALYNSERRHQPLARRTPESEYYESAVRLAG